MYGGVVLDGGTESKQVHMNHMIWLDVRVQKLWWTDLVVHHTGHWFRLWRLVSNLGYEHENDVRDTHRQQQIDTNIKCQDSVLPITIQSAYNSSLAGAETAFSCRHLVHLCRRKIMTGALNTSHSAGRLRLAALFISIRVIRPYWLVTPVTFCPCLFQHFRPARDSVWSCGPCPYLG